MMTATEIVGSVQRNGRRLERVVNQQISSSQFRAVNDVWQMPKSFVSVSVWTIQIFWALSTILVRVGLLWILLGHARRRRSTLSHRRLVIGESSLELIWTVSHATII